MTKRRSTRSALTSSVLALFLCVAMLVGTTFAWFTDSVTSADNIIKSGTLEVEMYYADGTEAPASADWKNADGVALYTADQLWEPGYTDAKHIKISNIGSLALKYQLAIIPTGEVSILADVIDVYLYEIADTDENATKVAARTDLDESMYVGTLADVISQGIVQGRLDAQTNYTTTIVLKMQEDADNEYQDKSIGDDFTIQLLATQDTAESDSFDDQYDKDAWVDGWQVYSASDLQAAINAGETNITIMDDIDLDAPIVIPASATTFSMRSATPATVIDLNGKTITGTKGRDADNNRIHVIVNNGILTIKDGTVKSAGNDGGSAIYNNAGATLTIEDVTLYGAPQSDPVYEAGVSKPFPSYAVNNYGNAVVNGATIKSYHGAIATGGNGVTVINDADIDVGLGQSTGITSYLIYSYENAQVTVNDGKFAFTKQEILVNGGNTFCELGTNPIIINGGNYTGTSFSTGADREYVIKGGTFDVDPSAYVAAGYKAVNNADGTFSVIFPQDSFNSLIDNAADNATIEIPAGEYDFPASKLSAGQTLNCAPGTVFKNGTNMDANGATIVGATFSNPTGTAGTSTVNGTFKNCTFDGANGLRWCYAGNTVVFENCVFSGDTYGVHFDGGANEVIFKNCTLSGFNAMGGAITQLTMEGCTFRANGRSNYNGLNMWGNTDLIGCTFVFDGKAGTEWVDLCTGNLTVTFTDCVVTDGETEKGIETVVGNYGAGNTIVIDGVNLATDNAMLTAAVAGGATKVMLANGEYDLNGNQKDGLTLVGIGDNVKVANTTKYASGKAVGAIWQAIHLENVTITNTVYTMADGGNATFTKVNFAAGFRQGYGKNVVFTDCTFGSNSEGYALHFQSDSASEGGNITLTDCEFQGGKVHLGGTRAYTFTGCDFAAGTDFQIWSNITLDGCTVDGVAVTADNVATLFPNLNLDKVTLK